MFGRFNNKRNGRTALGRGRKNSGKRMGGRCGRMGSERRLNDNGSYALHPLFNNTPTANIHERQAAPAFIVGDTTEGFCPLCKNHCPLSAPSCPKGEAYAASNLNN